MSRILAMKLARIRQDLDMNQSEFAKALNVTQSAVSIWERGHGEPKRRLLVEIAQLAGIPLMQLLDEKDVHKPVSVKFAVKNKGELKEQERGMVENVVGTSGDYVAAEIVDDSMLPFHRGWKLLINLSAPTPNNDKIGTLCLVGSQGGTGRKIVLVNRETEPGEFLVTPIGIGSSPYIVKPAYLHPVVGIRMA